MASGCGEHKLTTRGGAGWFGVFFGFERDQTTEGHNGQQLSPESRDVRVLPSRFCREWLKNKSRKRNVESLEVGGDALGARVANSLPLDVNNFISSSGKVIPVLETGIKKQYKARLMPRGFR